MANYIIEAINEATTLMLESKYAYPKIGIEMKRGNTTTCIVLDQFNLSYQTIEKELDSQTYCSGEKSFGHAIDLTHEEYTIGSYGFSCLNTWGKVSLVLEQNQMTEDGTYLIQHGDTVVEIELYNSYPWNKNSSLQPRASFDKDEARKLDVIENLGKASELTVLFVPKYHTWNKYEYDMYPEDDPGYVYGTAITITDKATGVPYHQ